MSTATEHPGDREALRRAAELRAPLRRAAAVARSNGTGYAVFGGLTLAFSLLTATLPPALTDLPGLVVGAVLLAVGVAARRLGPALARGESAAARGLSRNEALLLVVLAAYCILSMTVMSPAEAIDEELAGAGLGGEFGGMADSLAKLTYGTMLCVTLAYQGGLALYFRRRAAAAQAYLDEAPAWAREAVEVLGD